MYERGYNDALAILGLQSVKTARPAPIKAIKGLLGGAKTKAQAAMGRFKRKPTGGLKPVTQPASTAQMNQSMDAARASQQSPADFAGWNSKKPAPPQASRIDQFEAKMRGATPPATPVAAATPIRKGPEVMAPGQVPAAPAAAKPAAAKPAPAAVPEAAAAVTQDKQPGLLARGARFALPAAAVGGGLYAATRSDNPEVTPLPQQQYGAQYAPQYPSSIPMY